jgi:hypothetical protein
MSADEWPEPPEWVNDGGPRLVQTMIDVRGPGEVDPVLIPGERVWKYGWQDDGGKERVWDRIVDRVFMGPPIVHRMTGTVSREVYDEFLKPYEEGP